MVKNKNFPNINADILGNFARIELDLNVYTLKTIYKTAYWLTEKSYIYLSQDNKKKIILEIRPKGDYKKIPLDNLVGEFCNGLIDFRVRETVLKETKPIREALLTKAFTENINTKGVQNAKSSEKDLPNSGESILDKKK